MNHPFITYREPNENNVLEYYILQKGYPHYIGKLVAYPIEGAINNTPITDHHLYLTFAGCLIGNFIPAHKGELEFIAQVFSEMAEWYYVNRISVDAKKYRKWKIITP